MSKYEWERGTITLPSKDWAKFRTSLLKSWNDKQDSIFKLAQRCHKAAVAAGKGKRGKGRQEAINSAIARECGGKIGTWGFEANERRNSWGAISYDSEASEKHEAVCRLILKRDGYGRDAKVTLQAPKRKDLDLHPTSKDCTIELPDASVTFHNASRSVEWCVSENNRACEHAREHWFAGELFSALGKITWTRGTGGKIIGNDEYNRDSEHEGGGGNYVTAEYSKAAQERERAAASYRSRSHYSYGGRW